MDSPSIDDAYRRYGHSVLRRARQILGDEQDARDALHEVFVSLIENPGQFGERSALATWLYSATTHLCLNRIRDSGNRQRLLVLHGAALWPTPPGAPADTVLMTRELLARLPRELAQIAVYYHLDGMTHDEIADVVACSRRQVGKLLEKLQRHIAAEEAA